MQGTGLEVDAYSGSEVTGHIDAGPGHHTPWGMVHGGVYASAVESACSIGASAAVDQAGQFAVGLSNHTDFLRAHREGRLDVGRCRSTRGGPASSGTATSRARTASSSRRAACGCRTSRGPSVFCARLLRDALEAPAPDRALLERRVQRALEVDVDLEHRAARRTAASGCRSRRSRPTLRSTQKCVLKQARPRAAARRAHARACRSVLSSRPEPHL